MRDAGGLYENLSVGIVYFFRCTDRGAWITIFFNEYGNRFIFSPWLSNEKEILFGKYLIQIRNLQFEIGGSNFRISKCLVELLQLFRFTELYKTIHEKIQRKL